MAGHLRKPGVVNGQAGVNAGQVDGAAPVFGHDPHSNGFTIK